MSRAHRFQMEIDGPGGAYLREMGDDPPGQSWWQTLLRGIGAGASAAAGSVYYAPGMPVPPGCIPNPAMPGQYTCPPQQDMLSSLLPWLIGGGVLWYVMKKRG